MFPKDIIERDLSSIIIGQELDAILKKNSFSVNPKKIFLNNNKVRQEVTGLVVNKFPNIKREYIKSIRAILHNCFKNGFMKQLLIMSHVVFVKTKISRKILII